MGPRLLLALPLLLGLALALVPHGGHGMAGVRQAAFLGSYTWSERWERFGGFSGLELDAEGTGFVVLSDRARLVNGRLLRDGKGVVTGVEVEARTRILDPQGEPLTGRRADSEGLAIAPDGAMYISFEDAARVRVEARDGLPPAVLPQHPDFAGMGRNSALEALAVDGEGRLYTLPERPEAGRFPVFRFDDGAWTVAFELPARGNFAVAGADVGPDGRLYVLERDFTGLGFRSRLRRMNLDGSGEETLLATATGTHDNLESLAVWADARGLRATMISDDNFRFFQRTEFVDYRLPD